MILMLMLLVQCRRPVRVTTLLVADLLNLARMGALGTGLENP